MRTRLLVLMIGGMLLLGLLGGLGGAVVNRAAEEEALPPGASILHAERMQVIHSRLRYQLAEGQTIHDLHRFLVQQGWRRAPQLEPSDDASSFTRQQPLAFGLLEEDVTIQQAIRATREVEMRIVRCLRVGGWSWCGLRLR